jgi:hypothetical protein
MVIRSIAGTLLPLAGLLMYDALEMGWGNSLLGLITLRLLPTPILILNTNLRVYEPECGDVSLIFLVCLELQKK